MKSKRATARKNSEYTIYEYDHYFSEASEEVQCRAASKCPSVINLIKWPSYDAFQIANSKHSAVYASKATPTDKELIDLIIEIPMMIVHLEKVSPQLIDAAVISFNGLRYDQHVKVTDAMITNAISKCGMLLGLIRNRTEERCYLAISNCIEAIQWIDRPSKRIVDAASNEIRGLVYMFGKNRRWTPLTARLINTAREKLNNHSVAKKMFLEPYYRKALFSLIGKEEALFYLCLASVHDIFTADDFIHEPCDEVKFILLHNIYECIDEYQMHVPGHWNLSEQLQLTIARTPGQILSLKNPCLKARVAGIESIAGVAMSGRNVFDDAVCKKALNNATHKSELRKIYKLIKSPSLSVRMHYRELLRIGFPVTIKPSSIPAESSKTEVSIKPPPGKTKCTKQVEDEELPF